MKRNFLAFLFFIFVASIMQAQTLKGTMWKLRSIDNTETGKSETIDENVKLMLSFESDSLYSGRGCNNYKGHYNSSDAKKITMRKAETTVNPTCLALGDVEKELLSLYLKASRYRIEEDNLFIFTSDDHRLMFSKL